jgi:uncharacterized membrane protein
VNYRHMKIVYAFSCTLLCLLFLAPALATTFPPSGKEEFSELWVLGPNHMIERYPSAVVPGENYHVFLGASNHMGNLEYYLIKVKLRNQSEPIPNKSAETPSALPAIHEYRLILLDNSTWESDVTFSFANIHIEQNFVKISTISIDGHPLNVDKTARIDEDNGRFYFEIFFELWIYNSTSSTFQYHNRFVGFQISIAG